jgi:hypothetical protein
MQTNLAMFEASSFHNAFLYDLTQKIYSHITELQIKKNPVRHWVLQVREFCQTYQLFARPTFFLEIF